MDGSRFDAIVRNAAGLTRRSTFGALLTTALGWRSVAAGVEAEACLPNGQRCGRKAGGRGRPCHKCCSKHAPKKGGTRHCACVPFGGKCGNSGQCCEGDCNKGKCGCLDDGETCQNDADCCFSGCIDGLCQCLYDGEACDNGADCCFSDCVQGLCQCIDDGGACEEDFDCCFSNCIDNICQCLEGGAACDDDFDCCNAPCTDGVCAFGTCDAAHEICTGGPEPENPFCNAEACLCFSSTAGAPFCGDLFSAVDECSGCAVDTDCDAVTGAGSACVLAEDCCDVQGSEASTLCIAPCPISAARTAPRSTNDRDRRKERAEQQRKRRKQGRKKRH